VDFKRAPEREPNPNNFNLFSHSLELEIGDPIQFRFDSRLKNQSWLVNLHSHEEAACRNDDARMLLAKSLISSYELTFHALLANTSPL
jgi:hypothetical protein